MGKMNNIFHFIDIKVTAFGLFIGVITATGIDVSIKIFGGLIFVGYTARKWWLMEKDYKNKK